MKVLFATLLACFAVQNGFAQLSTSRLFNNHMVLQRNHQVPVWGAAQKNAKVAINFNGREITVKANAIGEWHTELPAMKEGGPYSMVITSGKETITYTDVMLGEVWLCSGQSNMEFQLKNAYGYKAERKLAGTVAIRQFYVPRKVSLTPQKDLEGGEWSEASASTVGDFTAVGYFFAKQLAEKLHVTVGLINSSWGGTEAEDWISRDAMLANPVLNPVVADLPINKKELTERTDKRLKAWAFNDGPVVSFTADELASKPASFFDGWQQGYMPSSWEWVGKLYSYRGQGFMQRSIVLDSAYMAEPSSISLGATPTQTCIYLNGTRLDKDGNSPGNKFNLPAGSWHGGANSFLIYLGEQKDTAKFDLGLTAPAGDLNVRFADTTVTLADSKWRVMPDLSKPYHFDFLPNNTAFSLYNSMINPLIPYAVAGVLWYQGESNTERAYQYREVLPTLITDWRSRWKEPLPFLFVQLASFGSQQSSNQGSSWAELREAQTMTLKLPNTAMATTIDVGDAFNIHPKNKATVGYRLAASAFKLVYHVPGYYESPQFKSAEFHAGYALVDFTLTEMGLTVKDKYGYVKGFEVAGADKKFHYAQASVTGSQVKVWCNDVPKPVAVRYAWTDAPVEANLFSKAGLPVNPFRTDDWTPISAGKNFK